MRTFLAFLASCCAVGLVAAEARIGVSSPDRTVGLVFHDASESVTVTHAAWLGEANKDKRLDAITPTTSEWRDFTFAFMPKRSGTVLLEVMGNDRKSWVEFAALSAQGTTLQNGDFTRRDAKGLPEGWRLAGQAAALKVGVKVDHDNRVSQSIVVEAGKPVTISFKAREEQTEKQTKKPETEEQKNR